LEGLPAAWARHQQNHLLLADGLRDLDLEFLVDADYRLPQLNTIKVPDSVDEAAVRRTLLLDHGSRSVPVWGRLPAKFGGSD